MCGSSSRAALYSLKGARGTAIVCTGQPADVFQLQQLAAWADREESRK